MRKFVFVFVFIIGSVLAMSSEAATQLGGGPQGAPKGLTPADPLGIGGHGGCKIAEGPHVDVSPCVPEIDDRPGPNPRKFTSGEGEVNLGMPAPRVQGVEARLGSDATITMRSAASSTDPMPFMNLQNFPSGSPFTVDISGRARPNVTDSSTKFELPINKNSHLATGDGGTTDGGKEDGTAVDDPNVAVTVGYSVGGPVFEITVEGKASGFWLAAGKAIAEALNSRFPSKESPSGGYTATWLRPSPFGR